MADYVKSQGHLDVAQKHQLTEEEEKLTLDQLAAKYPFK